MIVFGASRSGTSAVTGMFVSAGFYAGRDDELMKPHPSNPRGFFENTAVWAANEEIVRRLGGTWFAPPDVAAQLEARPWAGPKLAAVLERLLTEAGGAPVALKDPRIGVMLALWASVIESRLHPVLVIRDPVEIAQSLLTREGMPIPFGLAVWELHLRSLLDHLDGKTVTVVPSRRMIEDPALPPQVVGSVVRRLGDGYASQVNPDRAGDDLSVELLHHKACAGTHEAWLTVRQHELWRALAALPVGEQTLTVPPGLRAHDGYATEQAKAEQERQVLQQRLDALEITSQRVKAAEHRCDELGQWLEDEQRRLSELTAAYLDLTRRFEEIRFSRSWRLTAPLRRMRNLLRAG